MTQRNDTNRDENAAGASKATGRDHDRLEDDDLNDSPPQPRRDHRMEPPEDPPRAVHSDPPPGWDDFDDIDPPPPDDSDDEDCDIEGLGPPLSRGRPRYGWDSERDCMYRIDADEEGYED